MWGLLQGTTGCWCSGGDQKMNNIYDVWIIYMYVAVKHTLKMKSNEKSLIILDKIFYESPIIKTLWWCYVNRWLVERNRYPDI